VVQITWNAPITWTNGQTVTSAQLNAQIRDNMNETAPAKATVAGSHFVGNGANVIAERLILDAVVDTSETTASTSYTNLATNGPQVSIVTGAKALVWISVQQGNSTNTASTATSYEVTGATTRISGSTVAIINDSTATGSLHRAGVCDLQATTAGTNVFRMQYLVSGGTGTFLRRREQVMAL
jgi:hypothetical protein